MQAVYDNALEVTLRFSKLVKSLRGKEPSTDNKLELVSAALAVLDAWVALFSHPACPESDHRDWVVEQLRPVTLLAADLGQGAIEAVRDLGVGNN